MWKVFIMLCALGCGAWAQSTPRQLPTVIPGFKVTAETLAEAHRNYPFLIDVADYESARQQVIARRPKPSTAYIYLTRACKSTFIAKPALCGDLISSDRVIHVKTY